MLRLQCFFVNLLFNVVSKELLHASGIHQCLTWDFYDEDKIRFICRVSNFVKPVTLTDNNRELFAQCTFFEKVQSCQPSSVNSFVRVNFITNEVMFYVDRDSVWLYDGKWSCHVGREIFISNVSILKGIINDVTVKLESSMRNTNVIELKCSSCKVPMSRNAEFQINGRSAENIFQDRDSGKCVRHGVPCQSDVCGCSASGNEFSIQLITNTSRYKSFACDLIFSDPVNGAKFSKIAVIKLNGTDYTQTNTQTKIIKHGKPRVDKRVSFLPGNIVTTVPDDKMNSTDLNPAKNGKNNKGHPLRWIFIGILLALGIGLAVFLFKRRNYLCKGCLSTKTVGYENTNEDLSETALLMIEENTCGVIAEYKHADEGYKCEPCLKQGQRTEANAYCIYCNELYCHSCQMSHLSMKMTTTHTFIDISKLLCDLHGKREYTHICHNHKILICGLCLDSRHPHCNVESIVSVKSSNSSIKPDDISLMLNNMNKTLSTPNLLELYNLNLDQTTEQQLQMCHEEDYFQKCIKAVSKLRKENIQPKYRILFKTKERESSFYQRRTDELDFSSTV